MKRNGGWGLGALLSLGVSGLGACSVESDPNATETVSGASTLVTCDGPEDVALPCGANGRVCSLSGTCVYPAACVASATGPGVFRGDLTVDGTDTGGDLAQLAGVWCVTGNLRVQSTTLQDLGPLYGLIAVGNSLWVQQNPMLQNLAGLDALRQAGSVKIVANPKITSLLGLGGLSKLASLEVVGNGQLTTLDGLAPVDITSSVSLTGNGKLREVNALSGIVGSMYGYLHVQNEASLVDLSGFSGVTSIGLGLRIFNSDALVDLHGFDSVTQIGRELSVTLNDRLESLDGLGAVTTLSTPRIERNPRLTECAVRELLTRTGATCPTCTGQLSCAGAGTECSARACVQSECSLVPSVEDTPCASGYCDGSGVCASPAVLDVFAVSDGDVRNPPSTRNGIFSRGDIVSFGTGLSNTGPVPFATSSVRVRTSDPYVSWVWEHPIYTNQLQPGARGAAYPKIRIGNHAPEGHRIELSLEVDFTIEGVTRTATLPQSILVGTGEAAPGVPLTLDWVDYDDGHYQNGASSRDGHLSPGEIITIEYRLRNWTDSPITITSRRFLQEYPSTSVWSSYVGSVGPWDSVHTYATATFAPDAPTGGFEGTLEVTGLVDGEPFVATLPVRFPLTSP